MPLKTQSKGTSITIVAEGEFKIDNAGEAFNALQKAFAKKATEIAFDFSAVTNADVSFLQLLCSAHKEAQDTGITLKATPPPADMMDTIRNMGFLPPDTSMHEDKEFCLWITGRDNG